MNHLDVRNEISGERVCHGADGCLATGFVLERNKLGVKQLVGLGDGKAKLEPITCWRCGLGGDLVLAEPCVDGINGLLGGTNKVLDLEK
jgi:hypothetical protein